MAHASEYTPPTDHPYSKERLEAEAMARQAPQPQVVKVCENVYSAIGYAFASIIMVLTPDGVVVIETTESLSAAWEVMGELQKITNLPVKAVIYTHNHADHWFGTKAFFNSGVQVIAHENFAREVKLQEGRGDSGRIRAAAMYGLFLPESMRVSLADYLSLAGGRELAMGGHKARRYGFEAPLKCPTCAHPQAFFELYAENY